METVIEMPVTQTVEVPTPYRVETKIEHKRYHDKNIPVVVAQTIQPVVTESNEFVDVDVYEYEPQVIPVDVHVAKPVAATLIAVGAVQELHQVVNIPAAQYNSTLRSLNAHLGLDIDALPYIKDGDVIPFLGGHELPGSSAPAPGVSILGYGTADATTMSFGKTNRDGSYYQNYGLSQENMDNTYSTGQMHTVYSTMKKTGDSASKGRSNTKSQKSGKSLMTSQPTASHYKRRGCHC